MNELINQFIAIKDYMYKLRLYFIKNTVFSYTALICLQKFDHVCINKNIIPNNVLDVNKFDDNVERHIVNCAHVAQFLFLVFSQDERLNTLKGIIFGDSENDHAVLSLEINNVIYIVDFWIYFLYDYELEIWGDCQYGYFGPLEDYTERIKHSKFFKYDLFFDQQVLPNN